ncbi:MAG: hypothetical protein HY870_06660 [Chloroflexi bacterium]|nr:hypothetical protein [Chloroflexota bacterium]
MGEFFRLINALMEAAEIHEKYGAKGCVLIVLAVVVIIAVIIALVLLFEGP